MAWASTGESCQVFSYPNCECLGRVQESLNLTFNAPVKFKSQNKLTPDEDNLNWIDVLPVQMLGNNTLLVQFKPSRATDADEVARLGLNWISD